MPATALHFEYSIDDEVALRLVQPYELPTFFDVIERNRQRLRRWFANAPEFDALDELRGKYEQWIEAFAHGNGLSLGIVYRGALRGWIWYTRMDHQHNWTEIGYWLDGEVEGRGVATRACRAMAGMAFDALGFHRVLIRASMRNERSCAVPRRLGFVEEGIAREGMRLSDGYHDSVHFSMLEHEWRQKHGRLDPPFALRARIDDDLALQILEHRHTGAMFEAVDRNRAYLAAWLPWVEDTRTAEDVHSFRTDVICKFARGEIVPAGIVLDGELVGHIVLHCTHRTTASAELGYWLDERAQGRGAVTRCCRALMGHGFEILGFHRIYLRAAPANRRSCAVAERLGMTLEGTLHGAECVSPGRRLDNHVYAMLADPWRAAQSNTAAAV